MKVDAALIKEQGVEFAVVVVKRAVTASRSVARDTADSYTRHFGNVPVVVMSQDSRGTPTYVGRPDLVRFLASTPLESIPWRRWSIN